MSGVSVTPSQSGNLHNVFVYGSLMADDVVRVLLNRVPLSSIALLNGFHRYSIKGRVYPAILPVENKKVSGRVLTGITEPELYILDTFEDDEYERHTVEVSLEDSSGKLLAHTYVWSSIDDPNLYGEWDFEEWKQLHMKDFVVMTKGFVEELNPPESKTRVSTYESFYKQEGDDNHPAS
ncbi:AIG2-like protein D isoform X2 [Humulus lupulus]|uniref:AIG2-like protein D isoform X2 n=1 Tax=Humulus lupulus TaxID=3486 RepID=UPI002B403CFB|nr:AIG2-like protein D isoform X2 [Humulus lupulus]